MEGLFIFTFCLEFFVKSPFDKGRKKWGSKKGWDEGVGLPFGFHILVVKSIEFPFSSMRFCSLKIAI
jgi:hypothetical protein